VIRRGYAIVCGMMRLATCGVVLVLAACPKKNPGGTGPQPAAGAGCPSAAEVFVASYVTQDPSKGRSGWVVPLHSMKVEPGAQVPDYAPMDAAAASASGVPAAPTGTVWLATSAGQPCKATVGGYYAAKVEGPPASVSYGFELDGCAAPANPEEAGGILMVSGESPTGCRFEAPQPVAARLGRMDASKQWQRPATETPLPAPIAAAIPQRDCRAPDCEMLWAFGEVKIGGRPVAWSGAVNWLAIGAPAAQCEWKADRFSGFFIPGPGASAIKVTEGQEHPLVLSAALVDATGAKVLLAEGPGEYATYGLAPERAALGHHVRWMLAPEDAWEAVDHLGPICEPEPVKPAPLPKDATPVSPYP
jgi:hypothetical protein